MGNCTDCQWETSVKNRDNQYSAYFHQAMLSALYEMNYTTSQYFNKMTYCLCCPLHCWRAIRS